MHVVFIFSKTNLTVPVWFIWSTVKLTWLIISLIIWILTNKKINSLRYDFQKCDEIQQINHIHYTSNCTFTSSGSLVQKLSTTEKSETPVLKRKTNSRSVHLVSRRGRNATHISSLVDKVIVCSAENGINWPVLGSPISLGNLLWL